jgi:hypothetical protein
MIGTPLHGFATDSLANQHIRIDYLVTAGPRLVRIFLPGIEENQLADVSHLTINTPFGLYRFIGGHRLWHSPEAMPRTYVPDDTGLQVEKYENSLRLAGKVEAPTGLQKIMEIHLDPNRAAFRITHILKNTGHTTVSLAPWAITQLPLGGATLLPLANGPVDSAGLLPNRNLVFWPYTQIHDSRIELNDDLALLHGSAASTACKIGCTNRAGWVGYLRPNILLVKRFEPYPDLPHPDFSCNVETYTGYNFIELETLGVLAPIEPGESVTHVETWEYRTGFEVGLSADNASELIRALDLPWQ